MKAVVVSEFGAPSVLKLADIPKPQPDRDQVLVRVKAAGVGPWDAWIREGKSALPQPLPLIPGSDISGVVEAQDRLSVLFAPATKSTASPTSDSPTATPNMLWPKQG
jgi:NADPH:quinone reductase-like Zn-dependent oxidoreductase